MPHLDPPHTSTLLLAVLPHGGVAYDVRLRIEFDGVEHVGTVWFSDGTTDALAMPDRGMLPGRTPEDVHRLARALTLDELHARLQRALADKRRFLRLRHQVDELLGKVRYLNQVAVSMKSGVLDADAAAEELRSTEAQLHDLVARVVASAGVEERRGRPPE
ncbi:MAG: hypothetical protein MUF21_02810 [Gemmatimonadaceae bacterium]|jgi:hypothetical protein|nr:hypothetical protein [Gemmatimonadaceae bacterium]